MKYLLLQFKKDNAGKLAAFLIHLSAPTLFAWSEDDFFGMKLFVMLSVTDDQLKLVKESEFVHLIKSI
jgi:hypothetical protein